MCGPLLLLIVVVPTVEIFLLFRIGSELGFFPTMLVVMATAFYGLAAARGQGFAVLERLRSGQAVRAEVLDGPLLVAAAGCLLFPGFITDAIGLLLLVPPIRRLVAKRISRRFVTGDPTIIVVDGATVVTRPREPEDGPRIEDQPSP